MYCFQATDFVRWVSRIHGHGDRELFFSFSPSFSYFSSGYDRVSADVDIGIHLSATVVYSMSCFLLKPTLMELAAHTWVTLLHPPMGWGQVLQVDFAHMFFNQSQPLKREWGAFFSLNYSEEIGKVAVPGLLGHMPHRRWLVVF